jgi:hypothetical protein
MEPSFLTVTRLGDIVQDKNTRNYRQVFFKTEDQKAIKTATGKTIIVKTASKESSINAYEQSYLNDKPDFAWGLKPGDNVLGDIVTRTVVPYDIEGQDGNIREVSTYTRVVFGDTTSPSFEGEVQRVFNSQGRILVNQPTTMVEADTEEMF